MAQLDALAPSPDNDPCPTCGQPTTGFTAAVSRRFHLWRDAKVREQQKLDRAAEKAARKASLSVEAAEAARLELAASLEGHTHSWGDPVSGRVACTHEDCPALEPERVLTHPHDPDGIVGDRTPDSPVLVSYDEPAEPEPETKPSPHPGGNAHPHDVPEVLLPPPHGHHD